MSLHANLTETDRQRTIRVLAAWFSNDREALDQVLDEVAHDSNPAATAALVFGLCSFSDLAANDQSQPSEDW